MTIDEAIKHCEEVAEENDLASGTYKILAENNHNAYERSIAKTNSLRCAECASEHRQIAEWMRELKAYRLGKVSWKSPKAILPKDEKPVIVVNDDGLYAIAYFCRNEDWVDEWRIMYCPYDSDIWEDGECGKIKAWAELPDVPNFPAFSLDRDKGRCNWCSDIEKRQLRIEYYWIDDEGNTASYVGKTRQVATGIARFCPCCGRKIEEVNNADSY